MSTASFYDLLQPGTVIPIGSHTFEHDEIVEFASQFDPQPFHLDHEAAAESHFGALCASGWHTLSVWMGLNVRNGRDAILKITGYEGPDPEFGLSPGVRDLKWLKPVYVGDTISYTSTLLEKRPSSSLPGWAVLTNLTEAVNQNGEKVAEMKGAVFLRMD